MSPERLDAVLARFGEADDPEERAAAILQLLAIHPSAKVVAQVREELPTGAAEMLGYDSQSRRYARELLRWVIDGNTPSDREAVRLVPLVSDQDIALSIADEVARLVWMMDLTALVQRAGESRLGWEERSGD